VVKKEDFLLHGVRELKEENNPITDLDRLVGIQEVETPRFQDNRHMKVEILSVRRTAFPPLPPPAPQKEIFLVLISIRG